MSEREIERQANQVIQEAVRDVLLSDQPVVVNTTVLTGPVVKWIANQAQHVHTLDGRCMLRRGGNRCADEFDWWKTRVHDAKD